MNMELFMTILHGVRMFGNDFVMMKGTVGTCGLYSIQNALLRGCLHMELFEI
jgi:hypothetical protein